MGGGALRIGEVCVVPTIWECAQIARRREAHRRRQRLNDYVQRNLTAIFQAWLCRTECPAPIRLPPLSRAVACVMCPSTLVPLGMIRAIVADFSASEVCAVIVSPALAFFESMPEFSSTGDRGAGSQRSLGLPALPATVLVS